MGFQDRDYYREWWAKKEGYVERSPMRMNLGKRPAFSRARVSLSPGWHWSLTLLATVVTCLVVWLVVRAITGLV